MLDIQKEMNLLEHVHHNQFWLHFMSTHTRNHPNYEELHVRACLRLFQVSNG